MQLWCCVVSLFPSLLGLVLGNRDSFIVQVQEVDDTVMSVLNPTYNLDHGSPQDSHLLKSEFGFNKEVCCGDKNSKVPGSWHRLSPEFGEQSSRCKLCLWCWGFGSVMTVCPARIQVLLV